jgi:hypothetical protein
MANSGGSALGAIATVAIIGLRVANAGSNANTPPVTLGSCVKLTESSGDEKVKPVDCKPSTESGKVVVRLSSVSLRNGGDCSEGAITLRRTNIQYCVTEVTA